MKTQTRKYAEPRDIRYHEALAALLNEKDPGYEHRRAVMARAWFMAPELFAASGDLALGDVSLVVARTLGWYAADIDLDDRMAKGAMHAGLAPFARPSRIAGGVEGERARILKRAEAREKLALGKFKAALKKVPPGRFKESVKRGAVLKGRLVSKAGKRPKVRR